MTDSEQAFQLVVDFLRRKGLVVFATKLENSERVKIGKLSNAPTRLEALLLKGHAFEQNEQGTNSWENQEENSGGGRPLRPVNEDEVLRLQNLPDKKVKSKAKQMGLSKSVNQTTFRELTAGSATSAPRSDIPAVSILARADANKIINLPSRVAYRHSREPHTPLRTLAQERRAASATLERQSELVLSDSAPKPPTPVGLPQKALSVPAQMPVPREIKVTPVEKIQVHIEQVNKNEQPNENSEIGDEYENDDDVGFTFDSTKEAKEKEKKADEPATRGPLEIYPNTSAPVDSDTESSSQESDTDDEEHKEAKPMDSSIFPMDLEEENKPPPAEVNKPPVKKLSVSISGKSQVLQGSKHSDSSTTGSTQTKNQKEVKNSKDPKEFKHKVPRKKKISTRK